MALINNCQTIVLIILVTLSTFNFICPVYALKCYKCNSLEGFKDFDPDCFKNPAKGRAPMESGAVACLSALVRYMGKPVMVRFGIPQSNSNEPLVCGRQNAIVKIGGVPLNSHTSCDICNDRDGCNGGNGAFKFSLNPTVLISTLIFCLYFVIDY